MSRWPLWLAEIGLYAVFVGLLIVMALDALDRWRQLRQRDPTAACDDAEHQDDGCEVVAVRPGPGAEHDQDDAAPPSPVQTGQP